MVACTALNLVGYDPFYKYFSKFHIAFCISWLNFYFCDNVLPVCHTLGMFSSSVFGSVISQKEYAYL